MKQFYVLLLMLAWHLGCYATEHFAADNEYETALEILDELSIQEGFDGAEHERYMDIFMLRKNVYLSNRILSQLTESEKNVLYDIRSASDKGSSVLANNILCFWYNDCEEIEIPAPESEPQLRNNSNIKNLGQNVVDTYISVYPNPANGFTTIDYQLDKEGDNVLTITDVTGKIVEIFALKDIKGNQIWDTRKYSNGIYFYELKCDKQRLDAGKIIVEN